MSIHVPASSRVFAPALVALVVLAGCAQSPSQDTVEPDTTQPPVTATPALEAPATPTTGTEQPTAQPEGAPPPSVTPTSAPVPVVIPETLELALTPIVELNRPIDMATRPGSPNLYVATKGGRVVEVQVVADAGEVVNELLDIGGQINDGAETGLLGLTFSPDGSHLYLSYSDTNGNNNVVEMTMNEGVPDLDSWRTLLVVQQPAGNHNGGDIEFGPDQLLYVALGDGGGAGDPFSNGQDTGSLLGSVLRIDPAGDPYAIPESNPFATSGGAPEIFLFGVRNPWRISFDSLTGDLWIADVGQGALEEVDVLYASGGGGRGSNLGWNRVEGTAPFSASSPPAADYVGPIYEYGRGDGCSVTGGHVYRGQALPELFGSYIFGDFCSGLIWGLASSEQQGFLGRFDLGIQAGTDGLASFGQGPDGELYVLSFGNVVYRIDAK